MTYNIFITFLPLSITGVTLWQTQASLERIWVPLWQIQYSLYETHTSFIIIITSVMSTYTRFTKIQYTVHYKNKFYQTKTSFIKQKQVSWDNHKLHENKNKLHWIKNNFLCNTKGHNQSITWFVYTNTNCVHKFLLVS